MTAGDTEILRLGAICLETVFYSSVVFYPPLTICLGRWGGQKTASAGPLPCSSTPVGTRRRVPRPGTAFTEYFGRASQDENKTAVRSAKAGFAALMPVCKEMH